MTDVSPALPTEANPRADWTKRVLGELRQDLLAEQLQ